MVLEQQFPFPTDEAARLMDPLAGIPIAPGSGAVAFLT